MLIGRGPAALAKAGAGLAAGRLRVGRFDRGFATPARTARPRPTKWIVPLYEALGAVRPSLIVELNRAVAVGMASGPAAGLEIVDRLAGTCAPRVPSAFSGGAPPVWSGGLGRWTRREPSPRAAAAALTRNERGSGGRGLLAVERGRRPS